MINDVFSRVSKDLQKEYEETLSESVEMTNKTIVNPFHEFPLILLCVRLIIYIRAFVPARRAVKEISIKRLKTSWTMILT